MLITKHFILIHVPKTGGTFIRQLCEEHLPPDWLVDPRSVGWGSGPEKPHRRFAAIPAELGELPVLTFVRNPWDWYVSWYEFVRATPRNRTGLIWTQVFAGGQAGFDGVVRAACTGETRDGPIAAPGGARPPWLQSMRRRRIDYFSALLELQLGQGAKDGRIEIGRFENLRESFLEFLERHAIPVPAALAAAVRTEAPRNASRRRGYAEYYDEPLRDLVAVRAHELIERHEYTF